MKSLTLPPLYVSRVEYQRKLFVNNNSAVKSTNIRVQITYLKVDNEVLKSYQISLISLTLVTSIKSNISFFFMNM